MKTVKSYNRRNDTTYIYEVVESHWDPVKRITVPKRKLIGKLDKETGDIIPTGKKGRTKKSDASSSQDSSSVSDLQESYSRSLDTIALQKQRIQDLENTVHSLKTRISDLEAVIAAVQSAVSGKKTKSVHTAA